MITYHIISTPVLQPFLFADTLPDSPNPPQPTVTVKAVLSCKGHKYLPVGSVQTAYFPASGQKIIRAYVLAQRTLSMTLNRFTQKTTHDMVMGGFQSLDYSARGLGLLFACFCLRFL